MDVEEVPLLIFPSHISINNRNDNYWVGPTSVPIAQDQLDPKIFQKKEVVVRNQGLTNLVTQTVVKQEIHKTVPLDVSYYVAGHVHTVPLHGPPQKKGLSPVLPVNKIKHVKGVSCVSQCLFVPSVPIVPHVATEISVGARLQSLWEVWQRLGSNPRVVSVWRDGYILPFRERPQLSRFPLIVSIYATPIKNKALSEALASLI